MHVGVVRRGIGFISTRRDSKACSGRSGVDHTPENARARLVPPDVSEARFVRIISESDIHWVGLKLHRFDERSARGTAEIRNETPILDSPNVGGKGVSVRVVYTPDSRARSFRVVEQKALEISRRQGWTVAVRVKAW
jgi:hypothetical protein